jgi:hypothetical protein
MTTIENCTNYNFPHELKHQVCVMSYIRVYQIFLVTKMVGHVRFQVLTALFLMIQVFLRMMLCHGYEGPNVPKEHNTFIFKGQDSWTA